MDKIDRLLDALEHPEFYRNAEIETMLQDPEVREVFDLLNKTKSSLQTIVTPDIEEEWKNFEKSHRQYKRNIHSWLKHFFSKNTAASIAIGFVSLTALGAIVGVGINHINTGRVDTAADVDDVPENGIIVSQTDTVKSVVINEDTIPETVFFDEDTLETIVSKIAAYYGYEVVFNNDVSKSLRLYFRWNRSMSVEEVADRLNNFEHIRITVENNTIKVD